MARGDRVELRQKLFDLLSAKRTISLFALAQVKSTGEQAPTDLALLADPRQQRDIARRAGARITT
jgi:hypothetical protein